MDTVSDIIEGYMGRYDCNYDQALEYMQEDLDSAKKDDGLRAELNEA